MVHKSVFLCTKALLLQMLDRRTGAIMNIGSITALDGYGQDAYSAAKADMIGLTQHVAIKHGRYGVRANCIGAGTIHTPIWQPQLGQQPNVFEKLAQWYPLERIVAPEDVANAALFLASDEAAWITGTTLTVDGGLTAGPIRMTYELLEGTPYADY